MSRGVRTDYDKLRAREKEADRNVSICGETFDHTERITYKDDDVEQWECTNCGAEWYHDIEEES